MNKNVILKSTIRKPIVTILLTLLIGFISYGFIGKVVETIIVYRETNRLEGYFRSIGYLTKTEADKTENSYEAGAELIRQSLALASDDLQKSSAGVPRDFYNLDFNSGTMDVPDLPYVEATEASGEGVYNLDYWFYGELIHFSKEYAIDIKIDYFTGYQLVFNVDNLLAGYPDNIEEGKNYVFWIPARYTLEIDKMEPHLDKMEEGERYLIHAWHHPYANFRISGTDAVNNSKTLNLKAIEGDELWYIPLGDAVSLDFSLSKYQEIKNEIDLLNENLRAIPLIGTSDMSALPEMQLDATYNYIVEGRWLNREDEQLSNEAIVIPKALASERKLSLGDHIHLAFRALKDPYICYIRGEDSQNWKSYQTQEVEYEIVGIYSNPDLDSEFETGALSSLSYVPNSTLNQVFAFPELASTVGDKNSAYTFVLTDPRFQDEFYEEIEPKLKELGFTLQFTDNNGKNFTLGADPMRKSNLIGSLLFGGALLIAVALSVFLYLRQQRGNYATLRALGVPARKSNRQLITPLLGLGIIGSALGTVFSWQNAHLKAGESLSQLPMPSGVAPDLSLNPWLGIPLWIFVLLVLLLGVYIGNRKVTKTPVLELLQDNRNLAKSEKEESHNVEEKIDFDKTPFFLNAGESIKGSVKPIRAINNFSKAGILRAPLKSLLTIVVAAALLLALGWFQSLIRANNQEIDRLYSSNEIQIDVDKKSDLETMGNDKPRKIVEFFENSDFIERSYLSQIGLFRWNFDLDKKELIGLPPYTVLGINDLDEGLKRKLIEYEITFFKGYDAEDLEEIWSEEDKGEKLLPLIVPEDILKEQNWTLGDEIEVEIENVDGFVPFRIIGSSVGGIYRIYRSLNRSAEERYVFSYHYLITNLSAIEKYYMGAPNYFEAYFFTKPSMNRELKTLKAEVNEKLSEMPGSTIVRFWDEELLAVVEPMERNLSLMERLYPVTMVISAVIGGVLCLLLVLNQAKETALLRMLGVEKGKIRAMQVKQILVLTLIGLLLGFILLIALRGLGAAQPSVAVAALVYLVGALLGTLLGAIQVSNKKPMELLQVKE